MKTAMKSAIVCKVLVLVAVVLFAASCAQEVGEIDRTQLNIFSKKDLEGEWYIKNTVVEAPYLSAFTFPGDYSILERGVFEIQEENLFFLRTYEFSRNSQTNGLKSDVDTPYLAWLEGDEAQFTPNPNNSRDLKFAQGDPLLVGGKTVSCDGKGMHDSCQEASGQEYAFCGHDQALKVSERTHASAVCVAPTKYVFRGAPLAVYPIDSHFDLKYTYNEATGEPTNVLEENDSDLFWYEREYLRAKWGDNQVVNYQYTMSSFPFQWLQVDFDNDGVEDADDMVAKGNGILMTLFEGDAAPEGDSFRIFRDENEIPEYMDFVVKYIVQSPVAYIDSYGADLPLCAFYAWYTGGLFECASEQIKSRTAFMKVDRDDTYKPQQYDDQLLDKFGYYRKERLNYDTQYDTTYSAVIRHIMRYDLWENHAFKDNGDYDYSKMTPQPIVFYLSEGFPRDLVPEAVLMGQEWAKPFNEVIEFLNGKDAVPASGMYVVCENNNTEAQAALDAGLPVAETDPAICADMNYVKKQGDIRYSSLVSVNEPTMAGLLGFGPPHADPLTGKIIAASAHIYHAAVQRRANSAADMVETIAGYKDYVTMVEGLDIGADDLPRHLAINHNPPSSSMDGAGGVKDLVSDVVRDRMRNFGMEKTDFDFTSMRMDMLKGDPEMEKKLILPDFRALFRDYKGGQGSPLPDSSVSRMALRNWANYKGYLRNRNIAAFYAKKTMFMEEYLNPALLGIAWEWKDEFDTRVCQLAFDAAQATEPEDKLAFDVSQFDTLKDPCSKELEGSKRSPEAQPALAFYEEYDPSIPDSGDTCMFIKQGELEGYFWVNTCTVAKLGQQVAHAIQFSEQMYEEEYWRPSPWFADTKDPVIAKTQKAVRAIGDEIRAEMVLDFRKKVWLSVALHEVGHTVGLRHNFEASTDALNYPQEYWKEKVALAGDGKTWVPLDQFDPETDQQLKARMRELQYSSIMDYGRRFNDLIHGLGLYDHAAIKFGYGGILEVFKEAPKLGDYEKYLQDPQQDFAGDAPPVALDANSIERLFKRVHYTQIPNVFGGIATPYERENVLFSDVVGKACKIDGDCAGGGGCAGCTECRGQLGGHYCSPPDKVEVPYRFCSDELAGMTPDCDVWDQGADPYEIVRNTVDDYWWGWMWYGRWRGNTYAYDFFNAWYTNSVSFHFNRMRRQFQWWAINFARYNQNDWWQNVTGSDLPWDQDPNGGLAGSMAVDEAFSTLVQVFAIPEGNGIGWAAQFGYNPNNGQYEKWTDFNDNVLVKRFFLEEDYGRFAPRPMYASWYMMGDDAFPVSGGAIFDRLQAFVALTDPTTYFLNIDEFPDAQKYLISFFTMFPDKMLTLLGGLTTHNPQHYAACVVEDGDQPAYLLLRDRRNLNDPEFCSNGAFLEPEPVDYSFETTWYRIPMLAAYYGMSLMINDYDRRFMDTTRVFLQGHEDAIELPPEAEQATFTDPFTGKVYKAYKMGDESVFNTAWYLVNRANQLIQQFDSLEDLQHAYEEGDAGYGPNDIKKIIGLLELLRGLHKLYDYTGI